ncbi:UDP-N-acetylglucosamine transferase subunit alg13 [Penicillium tannophilum]|nr:UDP-N-acetylglucosamine transferase subunit alg13 [Penicillium tannophilum]
MVRKVCLVTVGATAAFPELVAAVANEQFFKTLAEKNFTHLFIQYGAHGRHQFDLCLAGHQSGDKLFHGIDVIGFDFDKNLGHHMGLAMEKKPDGKPHQHQELGLMITHAGTGSILEGLRCGLPLIIVPNPKLADNHQEDLAIRMESLGYGVMARAEDVVSAVDKATEQRIKRFSPMKSESKEDVLSALHDQLSYVD